MPEANPPAFIRNIAAASTMAMIVGVAVWLSARVGSPARKSSARVSTPGVARLSFNQHVRPVLSANCFHCHGQDSHARKAELRLDRAEFAFAKGKDRPVIIPGQPDRSPLVRRIESDQPGEVMPSPESHKVLTKDEIALLRRWVKEGAEYEEHWAFIPPKPPAPPEVKRAAWMRNEIDRFVLARLEAERLTPSPEADKFTLLRRATYDLTGLPPTPEEIAEFVNDPRPDAYGRVIDRLLASPRYGEHRARYWLDVARYGDTHGQNFDNLRLSWPFRDYVIGAYNQNKPFDRFAVEQIAGDLLPARTFDELIATGFNRAHVTTNEDGAIPEELQFNMVSDRVQTMSTIFLGLTTGCATCHDHKFDPISQRDFYRLSAFFNNINDRQFDGNHLTPAPTITLPKPEKREAAEAALASLSKVQAQLRERTLGAAERVDAWIASGGPQRLKTISTGRLMARLRFDEGSGNTIRNSAPQAKPASFETAGQGLIWGEHVHRWPIGRFGGGTRFQTPALGDFEASEPFTAGGWFKLREARLGHNGPLMSRMGGQPNDPGWEFFWQDPGTEKLMHQREGQLLVNLVHAKDNLLSVRAKKIVSRREWRHLAFTYDGSGRAAGITMYIDGEPQEVEVLHDKLAGSIRTRAPFALARTASKVVKHTTSNSLSETAFQDIRLYGRVLSSDEIQRTRYEEVAAEIFRHPRTEWNVDEAQTVADFYLREIDTDAIALRAEKNRLQQELAKLTQGGVKALVSEERSTPPMAHIFHRGVYSERGERVTPDVPSFLPPLTADARRDRLGLAQWLFAPENPLTARVAVNRMWQELFGTGIVETAGDFGVVGASPSHPELLDWLAIDFRDSRWNVKRFYRQVMLSATYRQAARVSPEMRERDPENRLLARGPRFRLDAEMIRDGALAASGLLTERIGGASVNTYQPPGLWEPASRKESNTFTHKVDKGEGLYRRSLYTLWKRTSAPPVLATFDAPMRDFCVVRRERTNTPLQALVTLNATAFVEASRYLASRTLSLSDASADQRIDYLSTLLLSRPANPRLRQVVVESLQAFRTDMSEPARAKALLSTGDSPPSTGGDPSELAAWTLAANLLMNTDEALNK